MSTSGHQDIESIIGEGGRPRSGFWRGSTVRSSWCIRSMVGCYPIMPMRRWSSHRQNQEDLTLGRALWDDGSKSWNGARRKRAQLGPITPNGQTNKVIRSEVVNQYHSCSFSLFLLIIFFMVFEDFYLVYYVIFGFKLCFNLGLSLVFNGLN